jgi:mRNA interferase RelE/StbE
VIATYTLKLHKQVTKFLLSLNPEWRDRFQEKLEMLRQNPHSYPLLDIKPMRGLGESIYRLRVGQYWMVYHIHENHLLIYLMTAGSRGDVYKQQ